MLIGIRADWVTGGIALTAVPLLLAPWLHRRLNSARMQANTIRALLLAAMGPASAGTAPGRASEGKRLACRVQRRMA